jgi:hypothetical protein
MPEADFNPSVMLYRFAVAQATRARERAKQHSETGSNERRLREIDSCIAVIILAQAALESSINWAHRIAGIKPTTDSPWWRGWTDGCPAIAAARGNNTPGPFPDGAEAGLRSLTAWRNYVVHGSDRSLRRLLGSVSSNPISSLTAPLAEDVIQLADSLFNYGSAATGLPMPDSAHLWVAFDER